MLTSWLVSLATVLAVPAAVEPADGKIEIELLTRAEGASKEDAAEVRLRVKVSSRDGNPFVFDPAWLSAGNVTVEVGDQKNALTESVAGEAVTLPGVATIMREISLGAFGQEILGGARVHWSFGENLKLGPVHVPDYKTITPEDIGAKDGTEANIRSALATMDPAELSDFHVKLETNKGEMEVEFYPDKAPGHVRNFLALSLSSFYQGKIFHRVIEGFMIQGGCPQGTGMGSHGTPLQLEVSDLKHERGVLSMARTNNPNSATCQFFIMHKKYPSLDGQYSAFGKLVDGYETLDAIATTPTGPQDRPREEVKMTKVTVLKRSSDTMRASN